MARHQTAPHRGPSGCNRELAEIHPGTRGPGVLLKGPRGPLKGPRGPFKGPQDPLKGSRGPLKGQQSPHARLPTAGNLPLPLVPLATGPRGPLKGPGILQKDPGVL